MSNGMYCSASHWIDSPSAASVMAGRLIFLTMTALPEREAATSLVLNALLEKRRLMASATALLSMMAPSTMLSGGTGSEPNAATFHPFPAGLSSTALTALDPMSRPTTGFNVLPIPNTAYVLCVSRAYVTLSLYAMCFIGTCPHMLHYPLQRLDTPQKGTYALGLPLPR